MANKESILDNATLLGIYASSQTSQSAESGLENSVLLCHVYRLPDGKLLTQPLDEHNEPVGVLHVVSQEDLISLFVPLTILHPLSDFEAGLYVDAPDLIFQWYYRRSVQEQPVEAPPKAVQVNASDGLGELALEPSEGIVLADTNETDIAIEREMAFTDQALLIEAQVRRAFDGLIGRLQQQGAVGVLQEIQALLDRQYAFSWKQKFMYTEFGLMLRREKQLGLALVCHKKALALAPRDVNIFFNIARTEYELGNMVEAKEYLHKALEIMPDFDAAQNFLQFLTDSQDEEELN